MGGAYGALHLQRFRYRKRTITDAELLTNGQLESAIRQAHKDIDHQRTLVSMARNLYKLAGEVDDIRDQFESRFEDLTGRVDKLERRKA